LLPIIKSYQHINLHQLIKYKKKIPLGKYSIKNGYKQQTKNKTHTHNITKTNTKPHWATFTYFGSDTRTITKLFKNINLKIAYKTTNTLKHQLRTKNPIEDIYNANGVYQLKCETCPMKYIGQTGRNFKTRFKEHIRDIRFNKDNSKFAQHILNTQHTYGPINKTMDILHI
jgi:hypothetical protein